MMHKQPWISGLKADLLFVLFPPFLALIIVALLPVSIRETNEVNLYGWVILVLMIDVAHVYSTLYKSYWHRETLDKRNTLLIAVPVITWIIAVLLYMAGAKIFWSAIAYLAVFHFIRQQYGFMRIYSRKEPGKRGRTIDALAIYSATLYPVLFWHFSADREFHWFIEDDFLLWKNDLLLWLSFTAYLIIQLVYIGYTAWLYFTRRIFNLPKNILWLGTMLSWYLGIVVLNGDLTFTLTNVMTHGIPYMALVYFVTRKQPASKAGFPFKAILLFVLPLIALAFLEEGLWDAMVWRDAQKQPVFKVFSVFPQIISADVLALIVPLLALPQLTHYVLDGFIWKRNDYKAGEM